MGLWRRIVSGEKTCKYSCTFTCIVVEASSLSTDEGRIDVTKVGLCVIILKTVSVDTKHHVTLDTSQYHPSLHAPRWTHTTSPFRVIVAKPVFIVTCAQSSDDSRSLGWSPYRHRWPWLMPSLCQHHSPPLGTPIKVYTTRLGCLGGSVHWVGSGCWPATLQISSSSSELAGGMIWTWRLWDGRPSRRWA